MDHAQSLYTAVKDGANSLKSRYWDKDWQVTIINNTEGETKPGREVTIMLYQALSDPTVGKCYSSAWFVKHISSPGRIGPIPIPKKAQFGALDKPDGIPRLAGPINVEGGQNVNIVYKDPDHPPKIEITGEAQSNKEIKITSASGNAKALDVALYKHDKKLVSFKNVNPSEQVGFLLEPVLYIVDVDQTVSQGDDFQANVHASRATTIKLSEEKLDVNIEITQMENGELHFSEKL